MVIALNHRVQRRMISVVNFFRIFEIIIFCFVVAICDLEASARCGNYISPFLCAYSIWKSFYEILVMHVKLFQGHHSYFRKDFQLLLTLKECHI